MDPVIARLPDDVFTARRARVLERLGDGVLVLPAQCSGDDAFPYRPDSELYWTTGLREPEAVAVLRGGEEPRFSLFVRERDETAERWSGPRLGPDEARERLGADDAWPIGELSDRLPDLLDGAPEVAFRLGEGRAGEAEVVQALRRARARGARKGRGPRGVRDPGEILDELRLRKDPQELERMRSAARVTIDTFRAVAPRLQPGTGEWTIQGLLDGGFRAAGGDGPAYETIVGSGPNACVLHYVAASRTMGGQEMVLVDAGASCGGYAADITRTFPVGGAFPGPGREVYEIVEGARIAAVEAVRPGATVEDVHRAASAVLREGLEALGVVRAADESEEGALARWFPHQTSHWLGLDVHDVGDYVRGGSSRELEPGMVLTIEPGLYFPRTSVEAEAGPAAAFGGIGVRIEDDVLVTATGSENLTRDLPTAADEVAALVRG